MKAFLDASFLIYLNCSTGDDRNLIDNVFRKLLKEDLYTNMLVFDETLYISKMKYNVIYNITLDFLKNVILPYVKPIPIEESDFKAVEKYLMRYEVKPSDAIHLATMEKEGIVHIVSEDKQFDRIDSIRRIWL